MPPLRDLTNQRFDRLVVIQRSSHPRRAAWRCRCDCGRLTVVTGDQLTGGHTISCGCAKRERFGLLRWRPKPERGDRFGRLMVIRFLADDPKHPHVRCVCDCGTITEPTWGALTSGLTKSCGCLRREITGQLAKTHGLSHTDEYWIWIGIIARCYDRNNKSYPQYGGTGVRVADRWREDFLAFLADRGPRPSPQHSIDRWPDPHGDYTPENTRWATAKEQRINQTRTQLITFRGETRTLKDWATHLNMSYTALHQRRYTLKWPIEKTLTTPIQPRKS